MKNAVIIFILVLAIAVGFFAGRRTTRPAPLSVAPTASPGMYSPDGADKAARALVAGVGKSLPKTVPATVPPSPAVPSLEVSGAAWVVRNDGGSDLLRGLEIRLVPQFVSRAAASVGVYATIKGAQSVKDFDDKMIVDYTSRIQSEPSMADFYRREIAQFRDESNAKAQEIQQLNLYLAGLPDRVSFSKLAVDLRRPDSNVVAGITPVAQAAAVSVARTNSDGKFKFPSVPSGAYMLHAEFDTSALRIEWLLPVPATSGPQSCDMFNSNAITVINRNRK